MRSEVAGVMIASIWVASRPMGISTFNREGGEYEIHNGGKPATTFLFKLISELQFSGTVPMIDVQAYAEWLSK